MKNKVKQIIKEVVRHELKEWKTSMKVIDENKTEYTIDDFKDQKMFDAFVTQISKTYLDTKKENNILTITNPKHIGYVSAYYLGFVPNY